ncbi:unnamed protein product, partial [marine sediment metagenome]
TRNNQARTGNRTQATRSAGECNTIMLSAHKTP